MKRLDAAEANCMLLLANNATLLGLHQVLTSQTSGGMLSRPVPNLCL